MEVIDTTFRPLPSMGGQILSALQIRDNCVQRSIEASILAHEQITRLRQLLDEARQPKEKS